MAKRQSSYVKVEKKDGEYLVTVMRSVANGHVVGSRGICSMSDPSMLPKEVLRCYEEAKVSQVSYMRQADGNS